MKNLEYFSKEGLDVVVAFEKSGHCFDFPHERILEIVRTFQLYNIDKEYFRKINSLYRRG